LRGWYRRSREQHREGDRQRQALSGPTDFLSLNDAAFAQVKARSISTFFSSSVLDWLDHCIASSSAYSRNYSAFVMERSIIERPRVESVRPMARGV
jgi:hypothetical protein